MTIITSNVIKIIVVNKLCSTVSWCRLYVVIEFQVACNLGTKSPMFTPVHVCLCIYCESKYTNDMSTLIYSGIFVYTMFPEIHFFV